MVLAFDTSAAHCAAALLSGSRVLAAAHEEMGKGQAERLMPLIAEVLTKGGASLSDLDAIGVGVGPGNFTGIRISVSAARGLALALGIPAVGVGTLEARAEGLPRPLTVIDDARRGEVYAQIFDGDGDAPDGPMLLDAGEVGLVLPSDRVTGTAAAALQGATALPPAMPLAEAIARIAARRFRVPALPRPAPLYVRAADAAPSRERGPAMLPSS
ncbi:tRNA (adenosine(37)-N6)-threonylcarbamoyltransferase complex dimerization subunit type 1 TsaB [Roseicyclus amphidinii]|uniref:tRNA (adenosine(37)-N6)-threonylcarbamoyltransferase complex dimerization subunit type 1 TsaB n=1 Tax=Roseicyclus amphidinii TaxID=3034232 RepID=UPI0024E18A37|nr:tRNA (adenosine(37)-N6)-threonylcarbamoyltransferase complex dimerization subunit type 1 TsaB [Roseicyclus sp. Amp-Y-6]